ncbi:hypothetical protein ABXV18_24860 [Vibrio owensii]|uniref:hypothetical protein n=1 Tax=Vibrio owensii TaxID=696485 RepID=UPI0033952EA1
MKSYVAIGDTDNLKDHKLAKLFAARMSDKGFKVMTAYREFETQFMAGAKGNGFRFADQEQDFPGYITKYCDFDKMKLRSLDASWIMKPLQEQKIAAMAYQMMLGMNYSDHNSKFLITCGSDTVTEITKGVAKKLGLKVVDMNTPNGMKFVVGVIRS